MSAIGHNRQVCGVSSCSRQWFHTFASDTRPPITRSRVLLDDLRGSFLPISQASLSGVRSPMTCGGGLPTPASAAARKRTTFTKSYRCNNSYGENFAHDLKLVGVTTSQKACR
jgi:hypothetical protein